ncbi:Hypothetical predicted protein, partial [Olea europaea subsp. europaea]
AHHTKGRAELSQLNGGRAKWLEPFNTPVTTTLPLSKPITHHTLTTTTKIKGISTSRFAVKNWQRFLEY